MHQSRNRSHSWRRPWEVSPDRPILPTFTTTSVEAAHDAPSSKPVVSRARGSGNRTQVLPSTYPRPQSFEAWYNAEKARDTPFAGCSPEFRPLMLKQRPATTANTLPILMSLRFNLVVAAVAIVVIYIGELKSRKQLDVLLLACDFTPYLSKVPIIGPLLDVKLLAATSNLRDQFAVMETLRIAISTMADYSTGSCDAEAARNRVLEKAAYALFKWGWFKFLTAALKTQCA